LLLDLPTCQEERPGGSGKAEGFADGEQRRPSASSRLPLPPVVCLLSTIGKMVLRGGVADKNQLRDNLDATND